MKSTIIKALFVVALFVTSCLAQAPAPTPTTTVTPPPASTVTSPSSSASPPEPEGPEISPGDLSPTASDAAAPPPNAAFSNKAFVAGTAFAAVIYAVVLA
ncbi:unnamed protein product [Cochlearia groenlandica]